MTVFIKVVVINRDKIVRGMTWNHVADLHSDACGMGGCRLSLAIGAVRWGVRWRQWENGAVRQAGAAADGGRGVDAGSLRMKGA